jgi:hypothetical protein
VLHAPPISYIAFHGEVNMRHDYVPNVCPNSCYFINYLSIEDLNMMKELQCYTLMYSCI